MKSAKEIIRKHYSKLGKKGGAKTARRGKKYYSEIGKKGMAARWGKLKK